MKRYEYQVGFYVDCETEEEAESKAAQVLDVANDIDSDMDAHIELVSIRDSDETYEIVRFHFNRLEEVIGTGLTLAEAQAHCQREDTHGDGWFDGYRKE